MTPLPRNKVDKKYTWNAESIFRSPNAWKKELNSILADLNSVKKYKGKLGKSPTTLLKALDAFDRLRTRAMKVYVYSFFSRAVDTTDQKALSMHGKSQFMTGQFSAATAFIDPELI